MKKIIILLIIFLFGFVTSTSALRSPTRRPCETSLVWYVTKHTSSAFDGGTNGAHGDITNGAAYTIFNVTGDVMIKSLWGVVNTTLVGAVAIEVGTANNTDAFMTQLADATALVDGNIWTGGVNTVDVKDGNNIIFFMMGVNDGADIEELVGGDITAGQIDYYVIWTPVEPGAKITSGGSIRDITP